MTLILCIGVSGVGKTTIGSALAARLGGEFLDADDFHPAENKRKMAQGIPLEDADRWGWLDAIHRAIETRRERAKAPLVLACSALKASYRERLAQGFDDVRFVYLKAPYEAVRERLAARRGHFMSATLLDSQFATLEEPDAGSAIIIDARVTIPEVVARIVRALS